MARKTAIAEFRALEAKAEKPTDRELSRLTCTLLYGLYARNPARVRALAESDWLIRVFVDAIEPLN